jgi:hypothetical protein
MDSVDNFLGMGVDKGDTPLSAKEGHSEASWGTHWFPGKEQMHYL